jgi:hypothetical protein
MSRVPADAGPNGTCTTRDQIFRTQDLLWRHLAARVVNLFGGRRRAEVRAQTKKTDAERRGAASR